MPQVASSRSEIHTTPAALLSLYRTMVTSRRVDILEQDLLRQGEAFFMVSGAGHEGAAVLASYLTPEDWLHIHYRDKALCLARGLKPLDLARGFLCRETSHSQGRQMTAHISEPALKILSLPAPVGNAPLQAAGVAAAVKDRPGAPIVLCSMGDGTTQEGETLEGIAEAVRHRLPVLFLIQDNELAISTNTTGKTFFSLPDGETDTFYGIKLRYVDGCNIVALHEAFAEAVRDLREKRDPVILIMKVKRLWSHTNADDQRIYRSEEDIAEAQRVGDPITHLAAMLMEAGVTREDLDKIDKEVELQVAAEYDQALMEPDPTPVIDDKLPLSPMLTDPKSEYRGDDSEPRMTMLEAIRGVLKHQLETDERVHLYGQDIEDPKGDVFGITKGLTAISNGRVQNAPLSESTIVGTAIGRALAGQKPVAFLQFADFFPLAFNQLHSELGSMHWRTKGDWPCPVIVMVTCGGYRAGLGPFHAQTMEGFAAHIPGVDVMMPYTAADAAGMLNAAFASNRPTIFFYPKNCLNDRTQTTSSDVDKQLVPLGVARRVRTGNDITLVAWGNTVSQCIKAADALKQVDMTADVLDLRTMTPWDVETVVASAEKTGRVIVVHEDNHTCGFGAEVLATVGEKVRRPVAMRRLARPDTHVSCSFGNQLALLPSFKSVLTAAAELLNLDVKWEKAVSGDAQLFVLEALGSSPSDESLTILEWKVSVGEEITEGQLLAEIEADKATFELNAPVNGVVEKLMVEQGGTIKVGKDLMHVRMLDVNKRRKPVTSEQPGTPVITRRAAAATDGLTAPAATGVVTRSAPRETVGVSSVYVRQGSRHVSNKEVLESLADVTDESVVERTGIRERRWINDKETAVSLASDAVRELLLTEGLRLQDIDMLVCATGTPKFLTPSMACLIMAEVAPRHQEVLMPAFDVSAACSGYLYALQVAFDYLQVKPAGKVLVVTTEVLSPMLDPTDLATCILFADAASATLVMGDTEAPQVRGLLHRPVNSAKGEDGTTLCVPLPGQGSFVHMEGTKVFTEAVKKMGLMLEQACADAGLSPKDLDLVVPHQANQRIIDAIRRRVGLEESRVYSNIAYFGNSSSTSIPLCLKDILGDSERLQRIGLCAFGGGFTFGAAILENLPATK